MCLSSSLRCLLSCSAFLGIKNTTNILIAYRSAQTNVANPRAVGGNRREFFFIDGCLNTFYFYSYLLAWFFANDPKALRDAISSSTTLAPDRQFLQPRLSHIV